MSFSLPQGLIVGSLLFLTYSQAAKLLYSQAVEYDLYLYADDQGLLAKHNRITEIKKKT